MKLRILLMLPFLLALSACTVYLTPDEASGFGLETGEIITVFEPRRGEGSTYTVGENISFRLRTTRDGYITLTSIDPDGSINVFARNIFVRGGNTYLVAGPSSRLSFVLVPPRGLHRVRASFTPTRTDTGRVVYRNRRGEAVWTETIVNELEPYASDARDVAQTYFYVR